MSEMHRAALVRGGETASDRGRDGAVHFTSFNAPYGRSSENSVASTARPADHPGDFVSSGRNMPNYRRPRVDGGTWFFTVVLADRRSRLLVDEIATLRAVVAEVRRRHPFRIDAMVVLPDHIHAVWTLPDGDGNFSIRWSLIKGGFTRGVRQAVGTVPEGRRHAERGLWQRRFWEHLIRDDADFGRHVDYCHINPMKHGLVREVADWPYSTFHRAVRDGLYAVDWAGRAEFAGDFGE